MYVILTDLDSTHRFIWLGITIPIGLITSQITKSNYLFTAPFGLLISFQK